MYSTIFDEKVNNIRLSQAQKQLDINTYLNENRILFFKEVTPILLDLIKDLGVEDENILLDDFGG